MENLLVVLGLLALFGCAELTEENAKPIFGYPLKPSSELLPTVEAELFADVKVLQLNKIIGPQDLARVGHYLAQYKKEFPTDPRGRLYQGFVYKLAGNFKAADEEFAAVDQQFKDLLPFHLARGQSAFFLGNLAGALEELQKAEQINGEHPETRLFLGIVCEKQKSYVEAREHYMIAAEFDPQLPMARERIAKINARLEKASVGSAIKP